MVIVWRRRDRALRRALAATDDHAGRDLHHARLVAMDLRGKRLAGANLHRADLIEADLTGADLSGADLGAAFLIGTQLVGANLTGAVLDHARLEATNLSGARLDGASLVGVIWDQATTWPKGMTPPRSDATRWHGSRQD